MYEYAGSIPTYTHRPPPQGGGLTKPLGGRGLIVDHESTGSNQQSRGGVLSVGALLVHRSSGYRSVGLACASPAFPTVLALSSTVVLSSTVSSQLWLKRW